MNISANILYSTNISNIQTCSLVIDGTTYQVQYENDDYIVDIVQSSGQASGNDTSVSIPVTVISRPVPVSDSAKSTMEQAHVPVSDYAGSDPNAAKTKRRRRINTTVLNNLLNESKLNP